MKRFPLLFAVAFLAAANPPLHAGPPPAPRPAPVLAGGPAAESLANAELAFARTSVEHGALAAWTAFFTADAIQLPADQPPVRGRDAILAWLKTAGLDTPGMTLDWWPLRAEVSAGGDLGYTFGEWEFRLKGAAPGARPLARGKFTSVWKKQADGTWKVILDTGNNYPEPKA